MILQLIIIFSSAALVSLMLTPLAGYLGHKLGILDIPGKLSIHSKPTPRTGGLAIFLAFVVGISLWRLIDGPLLEQERVNILIVVIAGAIVCGIGFLGDIGKIPSKIEFALQILPALLVIAFGVQGQFIPIVWIIVPLTVFYIVGCGCAMNLLDGMDGMAAGVAVIASIFFCLVGLIQGNELIVILSVALLGSALGFLYHNFPRGRHQSGGSVKIFMGDVGSLFLGFMLAIMAILFTSQPYDFKRFVIPLLILGVPILDTSLAIIRRLINRKAIISGDRSHFYDLLRVRGLTTRSTVLVTYGLGIMLGLSALLMLQLTTKMVIFTTAVIAIALVVFAFRLGALK